MSRDSSPQRQGSFFDCTTHLEIRELKHKKAGTIVNNVEQTVVTLCNPYHQLPPCFRVGQNEAFAPTLPVEEVQRVADYLLEKTVNGEIIYPEGATMDEKIDHHRRLHEAARRQGLMKNDRPVQFPR